MTLQRLACAVLVCSLVDGIAVGQIVVWSGNPSHCNIDQGQRSASILQPGTFKLQSVTNGALDDINWITVAPTCPPGTVNVYVVRNPVDVGGQEHQPGARHVKAIDLRNATVSDMVELVVTGDLAELDDIRAGGAGPFTIGDPENFETGRVLRSIVVDYLDGDLACNTLHGLTVSIGVRMASSVTVCDDCLGPIEVNGSLNRLTVYGDLGASVAVTGDLE